MLTRYTVSTGLGALITLQLLLLMNALIAAPRVMTAEVIKLGSIEFIRPPDPPALPRVIEDPAPPRPVDEPPRLPPRAWDDIEGIDTGFVIDEVPVMRPARGPSMGLTEGNLLPILKVEPVYPRSALAREIEGHVIVEFTVTRAGTVTDVQVVESTNPVFNRAAVKAASRFKYKPRVVDGQPVEVHGVRNQITFRITG